MKGLSRLLVVAAAFGVLQAHAAGSDVELLDANIDPNNLQSLQRGARNYMNYCAGCHSAKYVRYKTIGKHLELSEQQLIDNLMFNATKTFETIQVAAPDSDAENWYGVVPPDMSLIARSKGVDYIYSYLQGYYVDASRPTGVNNIYLVGTSMPHVLWQLQGYRDAEFEEITDGGSTTREFNGFRQVSAGSMDPEAYDEFVRDTVNFLAFIAEPIRSERRTLGVWVLIFLTIFLIVSWMLKKEIWKDVK